MTLIQPCSFLFVGQFGRTKMLAEYEVSLVAEITTTVTLVAGSEDDAYDAACDSLIQQLKHETTIETMEIVDCDVNINLNNIH